MKPASIILLLVAFLCASCRSSSKAFVDEPGPQSGSVRTREQAVAVVVQYIREHGGNPAVEEITARWHKDQWAVVAWHIVNPQGTGSSRFTPEGFTSYFVGKEGSVTIHRTTPEP